MPKAITHEEFLGRVYEINPQIEVLSQYTGYEKPVESRCLVCGKMFSTRAHILLSGAGCHYCSKNKKLTHEEFAEKLKEVHPDITVVGTYKNARTNITFRCKRCGNEWNTSPYCILKSKFGCKHCASITNGKKRAYSRTQFVESIAESNPTVTLRGEYKNLQTRTAFECTRCKNVWETSPASVLHGTKCPKCAIKDLSLGQRKDKDKVLDEIYKKNPQVRVIGEYVDTCTKVKTECLKCGHQWMVIPEKLVYGRGCPVCANKERGLKSRTNPDEFRMRLHQINPNITLVDTYEKNTTAITVACNFCNKSFIAMPIDLLYGKTCPTCFPRSKGERKICEALLRMGIDYQQQKTMDDCKYVALLSFDFYLPEYDMMIEYDGEQHFYPIERFGGEDALKKNKIRDKIKDTWCENHGVKMLRIPFWEYGNIDTILSEELAPKAKEDAMYERNEL